MGAEQNFVARNQIQSLRTYHRSLFAFNRDVSRQHLFSTDAGDPRSNSDRHHLAYQGASRLIHCARRQELSIQAEPETYGNRFCRAPAMDLFFRMHQSCARKPDSF